MSITELVTQIGQRLKAQQWKLAVAESCTGGGLAYWITSIPGSSDWFDRGFVTYSNLSKQEMLTVNPLTLETWGAVSEQTAREMAEGVLKKSSTQVSVAITGIAGPEGGTPDKPVGTVWIAWKGPSLETQAKVYLLSGNRAEIREKSIQIALEGLLELLH